MLAMVDVISNCVLMCKPGNVVDGAPVNATHGAGSADFGLRDDAVTVGVYRTYQGGHIRIGGLVLQACTHLLRSHAASAPYSIRQAGQQSVVLLQ